MKLTIKCTPEEIKNVLQAIDGSKEHENTKKVLMNADGTVKHHYSNDAKKYIDLTTGEEAI